MTVKIETKDSKTPYVEEKLNSITKNCDRIFYKYLYVDKDILHSFVGILWFLTLTFAIVLSQEKIFILSFLGVSSLK